MAKIPFSFVPSCPLYINNFSQSRIYLSCDFTLSTRTLLLGLAGSAKSTISGCLSWPVMVNVLVLCRGWPAGWVVLRIEFLLVAELALAGRGDWGSATLVSVARALVKKWLTLIRYGTHTFSRIFSTLIRTEKQQRNYLLINLPIPSAA